MAKAKLTHIGKFFQEFSHHIPILTELMIWRCALLTCTQQIVRIILVISDEGLARKYPIMLKDKGIPPLSLSAPNIS